MTIIGNAYGSSSGYSAEESSRLNTLQNQINSGQPENKKEENKPQAPSDNISFTPTAADFARLKAQGGGVIVSGNQTWKVNPSAESMQNVSRNPQGMTVMIKGVPIGFSKGATEKVGGIKGLQDLMQMHEMRGQSQAVVDVAVRNATTGKGADIMLTPQEYNYQIRLEQEMRRIAMNPNLLQRAGYVFYDPFGLKQLSAMADTQGNRQQKALAGFEAGQLAYVKSQYYTPKAFVLESALGGFEIASIATAPFFMKNPIARIAITGIVGTAAGANLVSEAYHTGELKFSSTFINLATIGLSAAGAYSGFNELTQMKSVDPVLKGINLKEFHAVTTEKVMYVPKYGIEFNAEQTSGKILKIKGFSKGDIYGFPQEKPIEIKQFDLGVELKMAQAKGGIVKMETINLKVTPDGLEPLGKIELNRFYPQVKGGYRVLESFNKPDFDFNIGTGEKVTISGTKPTINIGKIKELTKMEIVSMKFIGLEKPPEFKTDMIMKSNKPSSIDKIIKMTGDAYGFDSAKNIFSEMGIKDMTGRTPVIEIGSGKQVTLTTQESLLAEKPTAIGVDVIRTMNKPVVIDEILRSPVNINLGSFSIGFGKAGTNLKRFTMERVSPANVSNIRTIFESKLINMERVSPVSGIATSQAVKQAARMSEITKFVSFNLLTNGASYSAVNQIKRIKNPDTETFNLEPKGLKINPSKTIKILTSGGAKYFKISSYALPTATLESLERSYGRYGKGSLARGKDIERTFRRLASSSGLALEFPAAEFLRGGKRK